MKFKNIFLKEKILFLLIISLKKNQKLIKKLHEFIRLMTFYIIYFPFRILEN